VCHFYNGEDFPIIAYKSDGNVRSLLRKPQDHFRKEELHTLNREQIFPLVNHGFHFSSRSVGLLFSIH